MAPKGRQQQRGRRGHVPLAMSDLSPRDNGHVQAGRRGGDRRPPYTRPRGSGGGQAAAAARPLDRPLLVRHRPITHLPVSFARSFARLLLRRQRADVGVHRRVSDPEPGPRLFADAALQAAFVPVFKRSSSGASAEAFRLASTLLFLVSLPQGITALFILLAPLCFPCSPRAPRAHGLRCRWPACSSRSSSCWASPASRRDPEQLRPVRAFGVSPLFWNVAIIVGLVIGVPRADGTDAKLYVYAASILVATIIQTLLPIPGCAAATTACTW